MNSLNKIALSMFSGDTFEFTALFGDLTGDLTAATFTARQGPTTEAVINKTLGNGITKTGAGLYDVKVDPADTANAAPGRYLYAFKVTTSDGMVLTIMAGTLDILPAV